jgi:hypothetical protein
VCEVLAERDGLQRVTVDLGAGAPERAYVLTALIGSVAVGDEVVVNTTAVELGLGTGGWHVVHWNLSRSAWDGPSGGHVMKLRYTSLQVDTGAAEDAPGYAPPADLGGRPVVACFLHSQVPLVAAAFAALAPGRRLVYVMTDAGALPLALSDVVHGLREAGLLAATVTTGHAFGGDHEAVNVASGLDVAVGVAGADAVVVGTGPGVVGTGTSRGFTSLDVAGVLDAAAQGGGRPVIAVRYSESDPRDRHRGVSHHVTAALAATHHRVVVPFPDGERPSPLPPELAHHDLHSAQDVPDVDALLTAAGVVVTTMGRGAAEDPAFFRWTAAAGVVAAALV